MDILTRLAQASTRDVRVELGPPADPASVAVTFRLRRVEYSELSGPAKVAMAAMAKQHADLMSGAAGGASTVAVDVDKLTGEALDRITVMQDEYLRLGLVGISEDGATFRDVALVHRLTQAEPGAGRLHVSHLPPGSALRLSAAVMELSNDAEAYGRTLGGFRGA